ncbi:MAG: hypothetical protein OEW19_22870, partial [Acidobacteriota bacterium]|nr:hypothetical protein [Acidobacteriota bacterium]
ADVGDIVLAPSYVAGQHAALARVYLAARRYADALPEYARALDGLRKGKDANIVRVFEAEYAAALQGRGRDRESRAIAERLAGEGSPGTSWQRRALLVLARLEHRAGRLDRAMALLEQADEDAPRTARARVLVAEIRLQKALLLLDRRRLDDARAALRDADAMRRTVEGVTTPLAADILVGLGRVELAAGRRSDAVRFFTEADRFWRVFDPAHPDAREAATWLSRVTDVGSTPTGTRSRSPRAP